MTRLPLLALPPLLLVAGAATAAELTNREPTPQLIFITEEADGATQELTLPPGQKIKHICAGGCTLGLDNDEAINLDGHEKVVLKNGIFQVVK